MKQTPETERVVGIDPAWIVVVAGVSAALHVGKLPPAIPALRDALGLSLLQAGFMLSLVQFAGMALGIFVGLAADTLGLRRSMLAGLVTLSTAGVAGGFATDPAMLLSLRALEGFGFLLASMPGPSLIRQLVPAARLSSTLGLWGTYMPLGTALALLIGSIVLGHFRWPIWWWLVAAQSGLVSLWLWRAVPSDAERERRRTTHRAASPQTPAPSQPQPAPKRSRKTDLAKPNLHRAGWTRRLLATLSARGPWLVALCFAVYSAQWLSVIGFLPSIYAAAGVASGAIGGLTALAAAVNIIGNIAAGRLLQRGVRPQWLLWTGFAAMIVGAAVTFAQVGGAALPPALRYGGVLLFSALGGMIPATLFALAVRRAPSEDTVSTTVGWMQQWSSIGQFAGPPLVAALAAQAGGWQWTWAATGTCALVGMLIAALLAERSASPVVQIAAATGKRA
ncbi:MAG: MFS transporter [Burkholderiales bacterium]